MSKQMVIGVLGIFLTVVILLGWLLRPSDREQIENLFNELCEVTSKTEDASAISDAMVVKDFRKFFAPKITISIRSKAKIAGEHTDHELSQQYGRLRLASSRMGLSYENLNLFLSMTRPLLYRLSFSPAGRVSPGKAFARTPIPK
jgi:hypothetical protein